ncbi:cytochrome P450 [Streptomyces sp. NPDC056987]|uniref:cytochrome P450 n=1 Tax=Streptomyces sp. NPDC056987 TaxID=3345988 RepID=UPI00363BC515
MDTELPPLDFPFGDWSDTISPVYTLLRDTPQPATRVRTVTGDHAWLVTRYDVARALLGDPRLSLSAALRPGAPRQEPIAPRAEGTRGDIMATLRETGLRSVMSDALGPRAVRRYHAWTRRQATALIDGLVRTGPPADLYTGLAVPLPYLVACQVLLGELDEEEKVLLNEACDTVLTWGGPGTEAMTAAIARMYDFFLRRLPGLVATPGDHLLRQLAEAEIPAGRVGAGGRLSDSELAQVANVFLIAGYRTSASFLANALVTLARCPDIVTAVRVDPGLVPATVEELLRRTPMATGGAKRLATRDVEIEGLTIKAGECVLFSLESANHDPVAFPDPDRFDPGRFSTDRQHCPHLGFGYGKHHCPGNRLARMQIAAVLEALTAPGTPTLRLAGPDAEVPWRPDVAFRIPEAIPVTW